jgi:hypothetical protein
MATIQQSIEIKVPVRTAYNQLTQFEEYPQFMQEVEAVQQIDDTHLHWTTMMSNRPVEWDAEITEQQPDRCIAWHNISGPPTAGKVEVEALGSDASRVIFTLQAEPQQIPGSSFGNSEEEMAQRLRSDLERFKDFIEARAETGAWRGEIHDAQVAMRDRDARAQATGNPSASSAGYAAGSEGWSGEEDPSAPVASSSRTSAEQRNESTGATSSRRAPSQSDAGPDNTPVNEATQSDYSLSKASDDDSDSDGRFSVAEEVNLAQQSDSARRIGQMPKDNGTEQFSESASEAMGEAMHRDPKEAKGDEKVKPAVDRAVPPSE